MLGGLFKRRERADATPAPRADGWYSALTGVGMEGRDNRLTAGFASRRLADSAAAELWRGDSFAARIVEKLPEEAFRRPFELNLGDKSLSEDVLAKLEELGARGALCRAAEFERAFGGGAVMPILNDQQGDLSQPLNEDRIVEVTDLMVFEARELWPEKRYTKLGSKFGQPELYRAQAAVPGHHIVQGYIHESRLIPFSGIDVGRLIVTPTGWGESVLSRVHEKLNDFGLTWSAVGLMLQSFTETIVKIEGLAGLIETGRDEVVRNRMKAISYGRSLLNAVLCDATEEVERKQTPVSGLAELLRELNTHMAAIADTPLTVLFGVSPAGLNATGDADMSLFYDRVSAYQERRLQSRIERLCKIVMLSKSGPTRGKTPDTWSVTFSPLRQPTGKEKADERKVVAETDAILIQNGMATPEELAKSHYGGDTYSPEIILDIATREELDKVLSSSTDLEGNGADPVDGDEEGGAGMKPAGESPAAAGGAPAEANVAASAMNGAQVTSLVDVVVQVGEKKISRESGIAILEVAFRVSPTEAARILGPENFAPKPDPAPPAGAFPPGIGKPATPPNAGAEDKSEDKPADTEEEAK